MKTMKMSVHGAPCCPCQTNNCDDDDDDDHDDDGEENVLQQQRQQRQQRQQHYEQGDDGCYEKYTGCDELNEGDGEGEEEEEGGGGGDEEVHDYSAFADDYLLVNGLKPCYVPLDRLDVDADDVAGFTHFIKPKKMMRGQTKFRSASVVKREGW